MALVREQHSVIYKVRIHRTIARGDTKARLGVRWR